MRKKSIFLIIIMLLVCLTSCNLTFTDPEAPLSTVVTDDTTYEKIETNLTKVVEDVKNACVGVYVEYNQAITKEKTASIGSGVIYKMIDKDTKDIATENTKEALCYVITNEHVVNVNGGSNPKYKIYIGNDVYFKADSVGSDSKNDLAVLTFNCDLSKYDLKSVSIDDTEQSLATQGNYCVAIGCPLSLDNFNYVSIGHIAKVNLSDIMHTASINPGNSGGALFSVSGKLLGINYMKNTMIEEEGDLVPIEGMGYAIPIWKVKQVVLDIETNSTIIERPTLGIEVVTINVSLNEEDRDKLPNTVADNVDFIQGVVINSVSEDGNAANAISNDISEKGLKKDDVIYEVNEKIINRNQDIADELNLMLKGEKMTLVIYRKVNNVWQELNFTITLQ